MKRYLFGTCMALALLVGISSCTNEELVAEQQVPAGELTLSANIGTSTRTAVDGSGKVTWVEGDQLYAWGNGSNATFTLYEGAGLTSGLFTGTLNKGFAEDLEEVVYPYYMVEQTGNNVYLNLSEVSYGNSSAPMYGTISENVSFSNLTGMLRIRVRNTPDNATLTVQGTGIAGKAKLEDGTLIDYPSSSQKMLVNSIPAGSKTTIDIPLYAVGKKTIKLSMNGGSSCSFSNINLEKGKMVMNSIPELSYFEGDLAQIWDGSIETKWYTGKNTGYDIWKPSQLAGLAELVNNGNKMSGITIKLTASMDMNNLPFTAIGSWESSKHFEGTFDGNGKKIKGLNVVNKEGRAGLFAAVSNATIKKLTIVDSYFEGKDCGCLVAKLYGALTMEDIEVIRSVAKVDGVEFENRWIGTKESGNAFIGDYSYVAEGLGYKNTEKEYAVFSAEGLVTMSKTSIKGGEKVVLASDIDLKGVEFNGLNAYNPENNNTFDGEGYTVSNWTYEGGNADMGFIRNWVGPIKNITFENCHLKTAGRSAVVAAKVYGNIENVTVNLCSIEDSWWACGIIAGLYNGGSISNCVVTYSSVKSLGGTGGIVGVINESSGERVLKDCSVSNSTINNVGNYGKIYSGGGLVGMFNAGEATYVIEDCSVSNNTLLGEYIYVLCPEDENLVIK